MRVLHLNDDIVQINIQAYIRPGAIPKGIGSVRAAELIDEKREKAMIALAALLDADDSDFDDDGITVTLEGENCRNIVRLKTQEFRTVKNDYDVSDVVIIYVKRKDGSDDVYYLDDVNILE